MNLRIRLANGQQVVVHISGNQPLLMDRPLSRLARISQDKNPEPHCTSGQALFDYDSPTFSIRRLTGWVAEDWREVECRSGSGGWRVEIDGIGTFDVARDGSVITYQGGSDDASLVEQALLGPALALAFAANGVYLLHASAVLVEGQAVLFMGESGAGKSTLARWLDEHLAGATRIGDDILPVKLGTGGELLALPHFPQLKLPVDQQPGLTAPDQVPVEMMFAIERAAEGNVRVEELAGSAATAALISGTVAGSLFDVRLRGPHLNFCAQAAERVALNRLIYPHRAGALEAVAQIVFNR